MATAEWVQQALAAGKSYQELPERLRTLLPQSEWKNRRVVLAYVIAQWCGLSVELRQGAGR